MAKQLEVAIAGNAARPEIVLNDEHGRGGVFGNHHWPDYACLGVDHVIALGADAHKAIGLENFYQLLIRNLA